MYPFRSSLASCGDPFCAHRIVNDLLDLKKLEGGQMPFHFERCDARALLEQAVEGRRDMPAFGDQFFG